MAQRAADARKNFDIGKNFHKKHDHIKGVDDIIVIDSDSDSEYDEYDDYVPRMFKIEDSDSRDDGSEVYPYEKQDDVLIGDVNEIEEEKYLLMGRGNRIITQTTTEYVPSWNIKSYPKGDTKGVNMAQIDSIWMY